MGNGGRGRTWDKQKGGSNRVCVSRGACLQGTAGALPCNRSAASHGQKLDSSLTETARNRSWTGRKPFRLRNLIRANMPTKQGAPQAAPAQRSIASLLTKWSCRLPMAMRWRHGCVPREERRLCASPPRGDAGAARAARRAHTRIQDVQTGRYARVSVR